MKSYPAIERLNLIKEYIFLRPRSKKKILAYLETKEIYISSKTLERDFEKLKDLDYELQYIPKKGYVINHSKEFEQNLLNRVQTITKLTKVLGEETDMLSYVLDTSNKMEGIDLLPIILKGLENHQYIEFDYFKFNSFLTNVNNSNNNHRKVIPLWLKEDNERWYLIALPDNSAIIKTFGLDRIKNLKLKETFKENLITDEIINQTDDFKYRLGVSYPTFDNPKREFIELAISDFLLDYWRSKPVHITQEITNKKVDGFTIVTFTLIPNIDLIKLIVSGLGDIKLIGPITLKKYIQKEYKGLMKAIL